MNVYAFIIPTVLILFLLEVLVDYFGKKGVYNFQDTVANVGTGLGNQCVNLAVAFFVFKAYGWLYTFVPWKIEAIWYTWIILLVLQDFIFYWFHRIGHTLKFFWAAHMPHHSSEEFNMSVGIRASFTQRIAQFVFFDWVLVLVGFSPEMVYATAAIHLLIGYWHHTRLIKRMGWFEKLFVAPAHHRVHHGVNPQYIDKNFSEFLIIWDKLFGTFEDEEEEVCYGVTHPPRTWDPIYINIQYWKEIWQDAVAAPYWWDKIRIWFMPLNWRPRGLEPIDTSKPIGYNKEVQVKYNSKQFRKAKPYLIVQLLAGITFLYFTVDQKMPFGVMERLAMVAGVFIMIVSWGGILQAKKWSVPMEFFRLMYMAVVLVWALHTSGTAAFTGWHTIAAAAFAGGSILFATWNFKTNDTEGEESHPEELLLAEGRGWN